MVNIEYANAYVEVLEILKYISEEDYNKIPQDKINFYKNNSNKNYVFDYDFKKTLEEQNVSKIARGIIAILFRDYWATDEQRNMIVKKQNRDYELLEEEKKRKYNADNIFKNNEDTSVESKEIKQELAMIEISNIKWYTRVWNFIKELLSKK